MSYVLDDFKKFPLLNEDRLEVVLDSLTGLLNRGTIISLANKMINNNVGFSMFIFDIDNFKSYNDEFGHLVGDQILKDIANQFISVCNDNTLIGRYGGDEFLAISYQYSYDDMWKFAKNVLDRIRKTNFPYLKLDQVTITAGGALFPFDANDFDELMTKVDKALHRGKTKGRNCFIIYDDALHKNIDLSTKTESVIDIMDHIYRIFNSKLELDNKVCEVLEFVSSLYSISTYYIINNKKNVIKKYSSTYELENLKENLFLEALGKNSCIIYNDYSKLLANFPNLHSYCWDNKIKSFVAVKVYAFNKTFGTLVFVDHNVKRIWQKDDKVVLNFLGEILGLMYYYNNLEKKNKNKN